jgi:HK97 family phage major capsid protein
MNPEFQTWLSSASLSELGVKQRANELEIQTLAASTDAAGAERLITEADLTKAETLDAQITAIKGQQDTLRKAQSRVATLANANKPILGSERGGALPLAPERMTTLPQPKSIGVLKSFHGDREVLHANGSREMMSPEKRAFQLGTFILGAICANEVTRRQYQQQAADMGFEYLTMNEGAVGAGGYLVPPEFSPDFIYLQQFYGVARKYARNVAVSSNDYRQPRMNAAVTAAWEGELATIATSQMTIDQIQVLLKRISVLTYVSNELNADSIIGLVDWIVKDSVRQMGKKEDDAFFNGDGTLAYGNTIGIIPGLNNVSSNAGIVLQGTSTAWAAQVRADIEALMGALPEFPGMQPKFFCHNNYYRTVLRTLAINVGGTNLLMLEQGSTGGRFMGAKQWDGTEVVISQVLPATDPGTGKISLLYGDPEYSSTFISKGEYTVFQANQGDNMVSQNYSVVRIDERVGMVNHELGSSTLAGAMVGLKSN